MEATGTGSAAVPWRICWGRFPSGGKDGLRLSGFLLAHKADLFPLLVARRRDLFEAEFDVLLYDLTSTYFEINAAVCRRVTNGGMATAGTNGRLPQMVIALVVTPDGFPLAYEVMPGNTADCKTLRAFLEKIEELYGRARRSG